MVRLRVRPVVSCDAEATCSTISLGPSAGRGFLGRLLGLGGKAVPLEFRLPRRDPLFWGVCSRHIGGTSSLSLDVLAPTPTP